MESLMKLVADSFARHGIEPLSAAAEQLLDPGPKPLLPQSPESLPQHNFSKSPFGDPAP
jgi:hypothetical protein